MNRDDFVRLCGLGILVIAAMAVAVRYLYLSSHSVSSDRGREVNRGLSSSTAVDSPAVKQKQRGGSGQHIVVTSMRNPGLISGGKPVLARFISPTRCIVSRKILRERLKDFNSVISKVRIVPDITKGKMRGLRINSLSRKSMAEQLGLRPGDTVISVNGENLDSLTAPFTIYSHLKNNPVIQVELERQGQRINLTYVIQ